MKNHGRKPDYQGYNESEIFKDPEEMQNILSMKEIDREKFIAERIIELNSLKERQKLLGTSKQKPTEKKERKPTEEDENCELGEIPGKKERKKSQRKDSESNISLDSLTIDEDNKNDKKSKEQPLKKSDIEKIKLSRQFFIRYLDVPDFDAKIKGAVVRVHLNSEDKSSRIESGYIVGVVADVVAKDKPYKFNGTQCCKYLKVRTGANEQEFNFNVISNSPIEDKEFASWLELSKMHDAHMTSEDVKNIAENLSEVRKYQFNSSDRDKMFSEKMMERIRQKDHTINITQVLGDLYNKLETEKQKMREEKDEDRIQEKRELMRRIQNEIDSLENMKIERQKKEFLRSQKDIVAKINEKKLKEQLNDETKFSFLEQKRNREVVNDITKNSQYQRVDCRPKNIFGVVASKADNDDLALNKKESEVEVKNKSNKLYHLIRKKIAKFSHNLNQNPKLNNFINNISMQDDDKQGKIDELVESISFYDLASLNPEAVRKLGQSLSANKEEKDIKIISLKEYI